MNTNRENSQLRKDVQFLLNTPQGKRLLAHLEKFVGGPTYVRGDTHDTAFREGKRATLLHIRRLRDEDSGGGAEDRNKED